MMPDHSKLPPRSRSALGVALRSLVLLATSAALATAGVPPSTLWVTYYDGRGEPFATDVLSDLAVNSSGEVCATGGSMVDGGAFAAATVFFESDGTERWRHQYLAPESGGNEQGLRVFLDDSGRCRVTGQRSTTSPPSTGPDVLVLEYDAQGNLLWSASHDGTGGFDAGVDVTADAAGNVYVAALSAGDGGDWDILAIKYDAAGNELWARRFDGPAGGEDESAGIAVDADGNVYVAGTAGVLSPFGDDLVVIKYDADGDELWTELIDGGAGGADRAAALALDAAGHPHVAGRLLTLPGAEWHAAIVKLLPDGSHDWTGTADHPAAGIPEDVHGLAIGADGSAYLLATGSDDALTARFEPGGALLWDHLHDGVSIAGEAARPLDVDAAGNAYVAAYDALPGRGYDFLTYRLEAADGALAWEQPFGEGGEEAHDRPMAVVVDSAGNVLVGGAVRPGGSSLETDWAIVKYAGALFADGFEGGDTAAWSATMP